MNNKFKKISIDKNTKIIWYLITKFGKFDVRFERWSHYGISANSIIFLNSDIKTTTDELLKKEISNSPIANIATDIVLTKTSLYTYYNFNFQN